MTIDPQHQRIMGYFIEEAREHLETIYNGCQNLERTIRDEEGISEMFRAAHSIKGGAAMLSIESVRFIAYHLENFLGMVREHRNISVDRHLVDLFLESYAYLPQLMSQLERSYEISADMTEAAINSAQRTIDKLSSHLQQLVARSAELDQSHDEDLHLSIQFKSSVGAIALEMNSYFGGIRTDEVTTQLLQLCDQLHELGNNLEQQQIESSQWKSLVTIVREVINNPFNSFENLQEIIPQELEQAWQLVCSGKDDEIYASSQLQDLIAPVGDDDSYEEDEQTSNIFSSMPLESFGSEFVDGEDNWERAENTTIQSEESFGFSGAENFPPFFDRNNPNLESAWEDIESEETQFFMAFPSEEESDDEAAVQSDNALADLLEATVNSDDNLDDSLDDLLRESPTQEVPYSQTEEDLSALEQLDNFLKSSYEDEEQVTYMQMDDDDVPSRPAPSLANFLDESFDSGEFITEDRENGLDIPSESSFRDNFTFDESLEEDLTEIMPDFADSLEASIPLVDNQEAGQFSDDAYDTQLQTEERSEELNRDLGDDNPFRDLPDFNQGTNDLLFASGTSDDLEGILSDLRDDTDSGEYVGSRMDENYLDNPFDSTDEASVGRDFSDELDSLFGTEDGNLQQDSDLDILSNLTDTQPNTQSNFTTDHNLFTDLSFTDNGGDRTDDLLTDGSDIFADLDRLHQPDPNQPDRDFSSGGSQGISDREEDEPNRTDNFDFLNELVGDELSSAPANNSELEDLSNFFDFGEDTRGLGMTEQLTVSEPAFTGTSSYKQEIGGEFAELEALLGPDDDLAHLEALLEEAPDQNELTFQDLEALLELTPALTAHPTVSHPELRIESPASEQRSIAPQPLPEKPKEDKFADLENMLKGKFADVGKINTTPASARNATRSVVNNVRVDVKYLDSLSNLVGELVVNRNLLWQDQERLQTFLATLLNRVQQLGDLSQRMRDQYDRSLLESSLMVGRSRNQIFTGSAQEHHGHSEGSLTADFDAIEFDRYNAFHILSQEIIELIVRIKESASDIEFVVTETEQVTRELGRIANQLQDDLKQSRMVPFANLADRLPRGIRDRAVKTGKQAELRIIGGDTLIDKAILEQLTDPMTHLVNNAVDHGLETPEERRRAGKPVQGMIEVKAYHQGNQTLITVRDDGGGINPEKVKEKAVKKGLKTIAEVARMTANEAYELLFMAGFSTKDQADQFAGRGVGLDVVKSCLDNIKGSIYIDSQIGKGTQFIIRLPLTLSISKAIFCVIDGVRVAIPIDGFEDMVEVPRAQVIVNNIGQDCIPWQDMMLPFRPLSSLLSFNRRLGRVYARQETEEICVIIVRDSENNHLGLKVDQFLGEYEIVVKQLEGVIPKPPGIAGATVLGDGRVISIVNVLELFDIAEGRMKISTDVNEPIDDLESQSTQPIVLVVDDSIVVREMLSATFTKAGYFVESARDGQDAWDKLRGGMPCNLIFCDIEMPKMDGMQLLSRIKKDEHLAQIPIAMLTSRAADKHRQTAVQLGANAYFTKPYLEEELLKASQKLLKGEALI